jgi:hypothetical protein
MKQKKANSTSETSIEALQKAILDLHGCKATWIKSVPVKEAFKHETVWEGVVQVFNLEGHPQATQCYAWSYRLESSKKRRFFAVLHQGPIDSPEKAVRAVIVRQEKQYERKPN